MNIDDVKKNSIYIKDTIAVVYPEEDGVTKLLDVSKLILDRYKFSICNSTIAFATSEGLYVTPYTRKATEILIAAGFDYGYMDVPFSNGDYPKFKQKEWQKLRNLAMQSYRKDYEADCRRWSKDRHIGELSDETLKNCFRIPYSGVPVENRVETTHWHYNSNVYPIGNGWRMTGIIYDRIGHYNFRNGVVSFVYCDGHSYVTKGYSIIDELIAAGYIEDGFLPVPFSNREYIRHKRLRQRWEKIEIR